MSLISGFLCAQNKDAFKRRVKTVCPAVSKHYLLFYYLTDLLLNYYKNSVQNRNRSYSVNWTGFRRNQNCEKYTDFHWAAHGQLKQTLHKLLVTFGPNSHLECQNYWTTVTQHSHNKLVTLGQHRASTRSSCIWFFIRCQKIWWGAGGPAEIHSLLSQCSFTGCRRHKLCHTLHKSTHWN